eukprot:COSAG02_NODE_6676_length_3424_cov_13.333835_2_plen_71_part_00
MAAATRLVRLVSWNLWLIPNSSHELGPRPIKQAERIRRLMLHGDGCVGAVWDPMTTPSIVFQALCARTNL